MWRVKHRLSTMLKNGKYANQDGLYWEVTVPKGHYFAMGITAIKVQTVVSGVSFLKKT